MQMRASRMKKERRARAFEYAVAFSVPPQPPRAKLAQVARD
jgi:hypothetical protein